MLLGQLSAGWSGHFPRTILWLKELVLYLGFQIFLPRSAGSDQWAPQPGLAGAALTVLPCSGRRRHQGPTEWGAGCSASQPGHPRGSGTSGGGERLPCGACGHLAGPPSHTAVSSGPHTRLRHWHNHPRRGLGTGSEDCSGGRSRGEDWSPRASRRPSPLWTPPLLILQGEIHAHTSWNQG